ncbi:MAG: PAS domain S-box protein [Deltaproteobacteria bacterium]|nr:PAS domain S-box protein [Deltaproteobacteria bacterium]MBW2308747.1 PAS domain S-box protein [Deltaproteobacteria bacterium]
MSKSPFWDDWHIDDNLIQGNGLEPKCPHKDMVEKCRYVQWLKRHEGYMRNVLMDTADAILSMDTNNIIRSWNKGAERIYGYKREEIIGKPIAVVFPPDRLHELDIMARIVQEKGHIKNMETERLRKDGKRVAVSITRTPVYDDSNLLIGYTAVVSDITERKKMERQLIRTEKMASVGTFAAGLAHEIRNPLNSMSIQLVLLERRLAKVSDDFLKKNLGTIRIIREGIDRLVNLTNDFLHFSHFFHLNITLENIHALLSASISLMEGTFQRKAIRIERGFAPDLPLVEIDREKFQQVFLNLIQNSVEAMSIGGTLTVNTSHENESVVIRIMDTGCGIPDEQMSHIFEIFYSTKENGTGLGLAIVHQILELHGGEVQIESDVGKGTTCTVILPLRQER